MVRLTVGLLLIVLPVAELALLIRIGQAIGVWATLALVVGTALAGMFLLSRQSFSVFRQSLEAMGEGRPPVAHVVDGLFLVLAGFLLLLPGLISDVVALTLLIPPLRRAIAGWTLTRIIDHHPLEDEAGWQAGDRGPPREPTGGAIIEGDYHRVEESARRLNGRQQPPPR
jgi:UPF0716 protein FxsA